MYINIVREPHSLNSVALVIASSGRTISMHSADRLVYLRDLLTGGWCLEGGGGWVGHCCWLFRCFFSVIMSSLGRKSRQWVCDLIDVRSITRKRRNAMSNKSICWVFKRAVFNSCVLFRCLTSLGRWPNSSLGWVSCTSTHLKAVSVYHNDRITICNWLFSLYIQ